MSIKKDKTNIHNTATRICDKNGEKYSGDDRFEKFTSVYFSYLLKGKTSVPSGHLSIIRKKMVEELTIEEEERCIENAKVLVKEYTDSIKMEVDAAKEKQLSTNGTIGKDGRMVINTQMNAGQLSDATSYCIKAINNTYNVPDKRVFVRAGLLTAITSETETKSKAKIIETKSMDKYNVRNILSESARFVKYSKDGVEEDSRNIPIDFCENILADVEITKKFPTLLGIVEAPYITEDGNVVSTPGYNEKTELYFAAQPDYKGITIPDSPTDIDISNSIQHIDGLLTDFIFDNHASKSNVFGALLTAILRPNIAGPIPMYAIDKPQARVGGSLICEIINRISTGREMSPIKAPEHTNEDEWEKIILSLLQKGSPIICLDNIETIVKSSSLAMTITSEYHEGRTLGKTEIKKYPVKAFFLINGVNITFGGHIPVRVFISRILTDTDKPQNRTGFAIPDIWNHVLKNRYEYIRDVLIIAKAYHNAGKPAPTISMPAMGGFDEWKKYIGGIMTYIGKTDFLGNYDTTLDNAGTDVNLDDKNLIVGCITAFSTVSGCDSGRTKEFTVRNIVENEDVFDKLPHYIRIEPDYNTKAKIVGIKLKKIMETVYRVDDVRIRLRLSRTDSQTTKYYIVEWTNKATFQNISHNK